MKKQDIIEALMLFADDFQLKNFNNTIIESGIIKATENMIIQFFIKGINTHTLNDKQYVDAYILIHNYYCELALNGGFKYE